MDLKTALNSVANGAAVARRGGLGDMIMLHPEEPKQDPPRFIRVYQKGHKKYPQGTYRLVLAEDFTAEDLEATDWENATPPSGEKEE